MHTVFLEAWEELCVSPRGGTQCMPLMEAAVAPPVLLGTNAVTLAHSSAMGPNVTGSRPGALLCPAPDSATRLERTELGEALRATSERGPQLDRCSVSDCPHRDLQSSPWSALFQACLCECSWTVACSENVPAAFRVGETGSLLTHLLVISGAPK